MVKQKLKHRKMTDWTGTPKPQNRSLSPTLNVPLMPTCLTGTRAYRDVAPRSGHNQCAVMAAVYFSLAVAPP